MALQELPIGIQDFTDLRKNNYLYVDKTESLHNMITSGKIYFLSRPRRFGKSLMISTLEAIFQAKRELFENTWITSSSYEWPEHPVIRIDMSKTDRSSVVNFSASLCKLLGQISAQYRVNINVDQAPNLTLIDLIQALRKKYASVVVLVDEYDKPILDNIHKIELAKEVRDILRAFYGVLKAEDGNLRFTILTGITRFAKVSVFSDLNSTNDISMNKKYASILGLTQTELEENFMLRIENLAKTLNSTTKEQLRNIKQWYNGYRFSEVDERVYNPFSTLLLFENERYSPFWFSTGTPKFLLDLVEQKKYTPKALTQIKASSAELENHDINDLGLAAILYQAGYLTVTDYNYELGIYYLNYPNHEVKFSFTSSLLTRFSEVQQSEQTTLATDMILSIQANDYDSFFEYLKIFLAAMSYQLHEASEKYYQSIFYLIFNLLGYRMNIEVTTNNGRIDAIFELKDRIFIFELKLNQSADIALAQIHDKQYYAPYQNQGKEIILFGINFCMTERNIVEYKIETLD